jgi:hypothetical protein
MLALGTFALGAGEIAGSILALEAGRALAALTILDVHLVTRSPARTL